MASTFQNGGLRLIDGKTEILPLVETNLTALNQTTGTIPANIITGGTRVVCITTNATPGTQTTRTAVQLWADDPFAATGQGYHLRICNSGAGTLTLAGGTGVTVTGTATVATNTYRDFVVVYGASADVPTVTVTNVGLGTYT